ncbi:MAG: hypothetical protein LBC27_09780 [Spirochaetaceae bacterium]|jgi:hypothetical protein|nr:hypothetical protein [Spirochaetaceae bacterium]
MSDYKQEMQEYIPADELHENDAFIIDQPDVLNTVTEKAGVARKATVALFSSFVAASEDNAAVIDGKVEAAAAAINGALGDETAARQNADAALQALIDLGQGKGGALTAYDFGVPSSGLTQEQLIEYACEDIWGAGGEFAFDGDDPSASTYVIGGATRAAAEIFNNTRVRNKYNNENHKRVLTNTPDTDPAVYVWTDVGQDVVGTATSDYSGVAKLYNNYTGENTDGSVTQAVIKAMYAVLTEAINLKLAKSGGALTGLLSAMASPTTSSQVRNISVGTAPLVVGSSALPTGEIYICYE